MNNGTKRLGIKVDVLAMKVERAQVLPTLTPIDLMKVILAEFQELPHLGNNPGAYSLVKANERTELNPMQPLGEQLKEGDQVALVEKGVPVPSGAKAASQAIYLREQSTGTVYKLSWLPAIIGRSDDARPQNELVAANLDGYATGSRVSRRQAMIMEEGGTYWIKSMSENALSIITADRAIREVGIDKQPLAIGDQIHLVRSDIRLKFISPQGEAIE